MRQGVMVVLVASVLMGCAGIPPGPNVMVLKGQGTTFEQYQADDVVCRQYAAEKSGASSSTVETSAVTAGALTSVLGAATGAVIGAVTGSPGTGAAIGAGTGAVAGTAVGVGRGDRTAMTAQQRYDHAYIICMDAKHHNIPQSTGWPYGR
jgi:hypothetical protein